MGLMHAIGLVVDEIYGNRTPEKALTNRVFEETRKRVEAHGRLLGLLVDAVSSVVKVPSAAVAPPPEEIVTAATDYITGVARMGSRLIILLQLEKALLLDARGDS